MPEQLRGSRHGQADQVDDTPGPGDRPGHRQAGRGGAHLPQPGSASPSSASPAPPSSPASLPGQETEEFLAGRDLGLALIRPARKDEKQPRPFPNWLRQRVEAVIWTLNQLGLEHHGGRVPADLWTRVIQRLLALNAVIWHNWLIGALLKRSLIPYDHV